MNEKLGRKEFQINWKMFISIMPVTSVAGIEAAVQAGQLELQDTGIVFNAPVISQ